MSISQSDLKFIDTYLVNSDVRFIDIRIELTDHIATAVENKMAAENVSFYDGFKDYMAQNKKQLLDEKASRKSAANFTLSFYKRIFMQPLTLLFAVAAFVLVQFVFRNYQIDSISLLWIFNGILLALSLIHLLQFRKNYRFSGVETIASGLSIAHNLFLWMLLAIELTFENSPLLQILYQVVSTLFLTNILVYVVADVKLRKMYQQRLANLL